MLNTSYMTAHAIMVTVPKNLPTVQDDKMHLITRDSSVVLYDFKVLPPSPKVDAMSNEWAKPGETVTISGSYLFAPLTVQFPGTEAIDITTSNGSAFELAVPAGAQPGKIKVTTASGTAQSVFQYMDSRNILFNFDDQRGKMGNNLPSRRSPCSSRTLSLGPICGHFFFAAAMTGSARSGMPASTSAFMKRSSSLAAASESAPAASSARAPRNAAHANAADAAMARVYLWQILMPKLYNETPTVRKRKIVVQYWPL